MLVLDSLALPIATDNPAIAPVAILHSATAAEPCELLRLGPDPNQGIAVNLPSIDEETGTILITIPPTIDRVEQVVIAGTTYRMATDPFDPQPGEFILSSGIRQIQIYPRGVLPANASAFLTGIPLVFGSANVMRLKPITDVRQLPDIFTRFELLGEVSWSCSWEGHPTGSFTLICKQTEIAAVCAQLIPKRTEINLFGIGFEVDSLAISREAPPSVEATIEVSLRGKWERYLDESVLLEAERPPSAAFSVLFESGSSGQGFTSLTRPQPLTVQPIGGRTIRGNTTVQAIAAKVGAKVIAPGMPIRAPRTIGDEQITGLSETFVGNLRHRRCFARYSDREAIRAENLDQVPIHTVLLDELLNVDGIKSTIQGIPRTHDYKNNRLEWGNSVPESSTFLEETQGRARLNLRPQWRQKPPKRAVSITGSANATIPPTDITELNAGLSSDSGGPTKEEVNVFTEDGAVVREIKAKYGMPLVAVDDLYEKSGDGKWVPTGKSPTESWQEIEWAETEYFYDVDGWLSEKVTTGYYAGRLKGDNDNASLGATDATVDLFRFERIPLMEVAYYGTRKFKHHYKDVPDPATETWEELVPEFSTDGTRRYVGSGGFGNISGANPTVTGRTEINGKPYLTIQHQIPVPGAVDSEFCDREGRRKVAFLSGHDPDSTENEPKPDLTTGVDEIAETVRDVPDFRDEDQDIDGYTIEEYFFEHERVTKVQDAGLGKSGRQLTLSQNKGRPGEHTRKVPQYEKVDPNAKLPEPKQYRYMISTITYPDSRVEGGSVSYPYARTLTEALVGAKTDLEINNGRDTESMSITIPYRPEIKEGHLVNLEAFGLWWVQSYSNKLNIPSVGVAEPSEGTTLNLTRKITVPEIQVEKIWIRPKPKSPLGYGASFKGSSSRLTDEFEIGKLSRGPTRGNPYRR